MILALLCLSAQSAMTPELELPHRVVRSFESLEFLRGDYLQHERRESKPEDWNRQILRISYRDRNWVIDETGRYAMAGGARADLLRLNSENLEVYIRYRGEIGQTLTGADPMTHARPVGLFRSRVMWESESRPAKAIDTGVQVLFSKDGSSAWVKTDIVRYRGWSRIAEMPLSKGPVGRILGAVYERDVVANGGKEGALLVGRPALSGKQAEWAERNDGPELPPRKKGGETLVRSGGKWRSYPGVVDWVQSYDEDHKVTAFANEWLFTTFRLSSGRFAKKDIRIPDPAVNAEEPKERLKAYHAYVLPGGKRALVCLQASWLGDRENLRQRLYTVDLDTLEWKRVGDGLAVYGASASGRYLLVGRDKLTLPGWLIEIKG